MKLGGSTPGGHAEAHPQSWISPNFLFLGGGDDRTIDPGVSNYSQSRIKVNDLIWGVGDDRTVDPGVSNYRQLKPKS